MKRPILRMQPKTVAALVQAIPSLTPAELRVCLLILDGRSTREIARELGVVEKTVQNQRMSIRKKLGTRKNLLVELVRIVT
jgi:DNA-binding CsgD family transcriptional regulator